MTEAATQRAKYPTSNRHFPYFVAVQKVERAYGGPEEGGWHYDASVTYDMTTKVHNQAEYDAAVSKMIQVYELRGGSDVRMPSRWDGRCETRVTVTAEEPVDEVFDRPRYE